MKRKLFDSEWSYYEQRLEPIYPTIEKDGKHTYRRNYLAIAEDMMTDSEKERWYAVYEVKKEMPNIFEPTIDDEEPEKFEVGTRINEQISLPHQTRTLDGMAITLGAHNGRILEALSKKYLEFIGVVSDSELHSKEEL